MIALLGLYAALEGFGIGLLLPVLEFLESGGDVVPTGGMWPYLTAVGDALGLEITLGTLLALAFTPILLRQIVFYVMTWHNAVIQNRAIERLMVRAFKSVAHAELRYIESQDQGRLLGLVVGQITRCGTALIQFIRLLSTVVIIFVYAVILALVSWPLAIIAIVSMAVVSGLLKRILAKSRVYGRDVTNASVAITAAVRERLAAIRLVKMRAREDVEAEHIGSLAATLRQASTKIAVASARVEVIVDPALMLAVFVIVYVGVSAFDMTLASLGLFMFILLRLNAKAKEFNLGRQALASTMPSFDYVETMLAEAEGMPTARGGDRPFEGLRDAIQFDDVHFSYGGDTPVLDGVTLRIPRGSLTAVVGRSGAGKSTLVDMIPLLRVPQSGEIRFDDVPADEYDLASLRMHIGFLTQEPILFNDTIRANLTYGLDGEVSDEAIALALDESYCSEFVQLLPAGIETRLGDRGVRFSGGQRQRLALARVLLQDPDILILDEPTSSLDSESEAYIQRAFERVAEQRTVVVIAHRLATVQKADQIVVLDGGRVGERGTHEELLVNDGPYRRLFDQQIMA